MEGTPPEHGPHARLGIGLRGYGQKDPKEEYKREGFEMFQEMLYMIRETTIKDLSRIRIKTEEAIDEDEFKHEENEANLSYQARKRPRNPSSSPREGRLPRWAATSLVLVAAAKNTRNAAA